MTAAISPRREISLTFDDGPDPVWTPRVLDALLASQARATFFVVTPLARRRPGLISEMLERGHGVEFHCVEHVRHTDLDRDEIEKDARTGLRDLESLGVKPRLWRTPWGITTPATLETSRKLGLQVTPWTEDTHDWRGDPASEMLASISPSLAPGSVVLMHDGIGPGARRDGCEETVALIEPLVGRIRALGCEPAPMRPARDAKHEVNI
ncbi:MAG: polysaccharide deacetylase family protein [Rubrobacteraceae bacterium]